MFQQLWAQVLEVLVSHRDKVLPKVTVSEYKVSRNYCYVGILCFLLPETRKLKKKKKSPSLQSTVIDSDDQQEAGLLLHSGSRKKHMWALLVLLPNMTLNKQVEQPILRKAWWQGAQKTHSWESPRKVLKQTEVVVESKGNLECIVGKRTKKINCGAKYNYPSENCAVSITFVS